LPDRELVGAQSALRRGPCRSRGGLQGTIAAVASALPTWKRILVVGNCGAGKSTLASQVSDRLGLPVIGLDRYYWGPGWTPASPEAWRHKISELVSAPEWIMDGNFFNSLDLRLQRADAVVFLDLPRRTCGRRALGRLLRWWGRTRPDLPSGCCESLDLDFLRYIWRFPTERRVELLTALAEAPTRPPSFDSHTHGKSDRGGPRWMPDQCPDSTDRSLCVPSDGGCSLLVEPGK
jgi:adenylate kinase family enzyme